MKIVVTGSLGNISKPLTQKLVKLGHDITVISSKPEKAHDIEAIGAKPANGNLEDVNFLTKTFTGVDAVYCMMPPFNYYDPKVNAMTEARKLANNYTQAICNSNVKKVVQLSSIGAHLEKGNGLIAFHNLAENIFKQLPEDVTLIHLRASGFYNNIIALKDMVKGKGFAGLYMTVRYAGILPALTGKRGVIAANNGADDKTPWVLLKTLR